MFKLTLVNKRLKVLKTICWQSHEIKLRIAVLITFTILLQKIIRVNQAYLHSGYVIFEGEIISVYTRLHIAL